MSIATSKPQLVILDEGQILPLVDNNGLFISERDGSSCLVLLGGPAEGPRHFVIMRGDDHALMMKKAQRLDELTIVPLPTPTGDAS